MAGISYKRHRFPPDWARIDPTREAVGLLVMAIRITSYNVCYTKLLRGGVLGRCLPQLQQNRYHRQS